MFSLPTQPSVHYNTKALYQIVGIACLAGFSVDMLLLVMPLALNSLEWRIHFMQQISERSIIVLFGAALLIYGSLERRKTRKQIAIACLVFGVALSLACVPVIRDTLALQNRTISNINQQVSQVQTQIEQVKVDPKVAPNITPEQLKQAAQLVTNRAAALKQDAQTGTLKTGIAIVGNLLVIGIALIGLGRYGLHPPKI